MRLVTFVPGAGPAEPRVGVLQDGSVRELPTTLPDGRRTSMVSLIDIAGQDPAALESFAESAVAGDAPTHSLQDARLLAPIANLPGNVICLGRNYAEHAGEMARAQHSEPTRPTFFTKAVTSVNGPYDAIPYDASLSVHLDWEVELAVVIGRLADRVEAGDAMSHVFGFMVLNDVSARDLQYDYGGQFFYGKSLNGSCPMGPCIVTPDEAPDPGNMALRLTVNGQVKQEGNARDMIFDIPTIIATLSRVMTLLPGQVIATGTPAGVGHARNPPEYLHPGDIMESTIEGIGTLRNEVVDVRRA